MAEPIHSGLEKSDLRSEAWREYDFCGRVYRIDLPQALYYRKGGSTHRVVALDAKGETVVHCVPAPGVAGCVLRWCSMDPDKPVAF